MIFHAGDRLERRKEVIDEMYPSFENDIPPLFNEINIGKLSKEGAVTLDRCNAARKTRRLLVNEFKEIAADMIT